MISVERRQAIEKRIASRIVKDALAMDYTVSVWEGGDWAIKRSGSYKAIMASLMSTDEDTLVFRKVGEPTGPAAGKVFLVYGNDGYDVICDHSDNEAIKSIIAGAEALAGKIEERVG